MSFFDQTEAGDADEPPRNKFPLKRVEPALKKFVMVLEIDIDRLEKHKQNIKKFEVLGDEAALHKEQVNACLTIQQLKSNLRQLENTRSQVQDSDLSGFDAKIQQVHTDASVAVSTFLSIHKVTEQSPLQEFSSNRIGPSHPRSLGLSYEEEEEETTEHQTQLYADLESPSHDSWMKLEEDLHDLNSVIHDFSEIVEDQAKVINQIEDNVEVASENVEQGTHFLGKAVKLKAAMFPLAGAVLGGIVGGPIGLVAGLKIGGLAAVGGGLAGFTGGRFLKKRQEAVVSMEMDNMEVRRSQSAPDFSQTSFKAPVDQQDDSDNEFDIIKAESY